MKVPFYGHVRQYHNIKKEIDANMQEVLESGQYVMGPMLKRFEKELAAYHGMKHAIGVGNGTDALWLAFMALGIGPGDECITTTNTFFATAEAIWIAGATAVFVDSDPQDELHRPGQDRGGDHAQDQGHRPGAPLRPVRGHEGASARSRTSTSCSWSRTTRRPSAPRGDGFKIGELSDAVCTSFIIQKNLGTFGDGGAVVTNHADDGPRGPQAAQPRLGEALLHSFGFNSRLDDLHAGVLSAKLKHIDEWNDLRRKWAARYTAGLAGAKNFTLPYETARLPPRVPPLRGRDQEAGAARRAAEVPERRTASTPSATTRSPSTSRKAIPGASRRASPAPSPTPSATPPAASRCRCSPS